MSEIITASNIDLVVKKNQRIAEEVSAQAFQLQTNMSIMRVASMPQLALLILRGFGLIQIPIEDKYWSGAIFVKDEKIIPVLNTALPRANQYFAAWHEIYHLVFDKVLIDHVIENDNMMEERKAEFFAARILLQGIEKYFAELPPMDLLSKVFYCMSTFQAPYKAVLISLYEDASRNENEKLKSKIKKIIDLRIENIAEKFQELGLDDDLVLPSYVINAACLQERIRRRKLADPELQYHGDNEVFLSGILKEMQIITRRHE